MLSNSDHPDRVEDQPNVVGGPYATMKPVAPGTALFKLTATMVLTVLVLFAVVRAFVFMVDWSNYKPLIKKAEILLADRGVSHKGVKYLGETNDVEINATEYAYPQDYKVHKFRVRLYRDTKINKTYGDVYIYIDMNEKGYRTNLFYFNSMKPVGAAKPR